jgi:hypothetical protein
MNELTTIVDLTFRVLIGKIGPAAQNSNFPWFWQVLMAGFVLVWPFSQGNLSLRYVSASKWCENFAIPLVKESENRIPMPHPSVLLFRKPMLELCRFASLHSQRIPEGTGCEPYWQHIARCRELRMVHEMLPPPCVI